MTQREKLMNVPMVENDVDAKTVGDFLKMLLLYLWAEAENFSGKRPFGNSDWQYQVYASLIKAGYEIGTLDEDGYVDDVDYAKADKLIGDAIAAVFDNNKQALKEGGENMTIKQVRNSLVQSLAENAYLNMCTSDEMIIAISALDKQIPEKVILEEDQCICPCCLFDMMGVYDFTNDDTTDPKFCPECGQALDWSDAE